MFWGILKGMQIDLQVRQIALARKSEYRTMNC